MTRVAKSKNNSQGELPSEGISAKVQDTSNGPQGKDELQVGSVNSGLQSTNSWATRTEGKQQKTSRGTTKQKGPKFS